MLNIDEVISFVRNKQEQLGIKKVLNGVLVINLLGD